MGDLIVSMSLKTIEVRWVSNQNNAGSVDYSIVITALPVSFVNQTHSENTHSHCSKRAYVSEKPFKHVFVFLND